MKKILLSLFLVLLLVGCTKTDSLNIEPLENPPLVTITMESGDVMVAELYPHIAPNTVNNFIELAQNNFYDGLIFHRVIPGFMIQGGDPDGLGTGGPGYSIKGEFKSNGFQNELKHTEGILSMARSQHPDSAGSQFFIMHGESPHLDGEYAGFGKVIEGLEVIDTIANTTRDGGDRPLEDQVIQSIDVSLNDYTPSKLEKIKH